MKISEIKNFNTKIFLNSLPLSLQMPLNLFNFSASSLLLFFSIYLSDPTVGDVLLPTSILCSVSIDEAVQEDKRKQTAKAHQSNRRRIKINRSYFKILLHIILCVLYIHNVHDKLYNFLLLFYMKK